jgi:hypothetical protein
VTGLMQACLTLFKGRESFALPSKMRKNLEVRRAVIP